jgi:hypothetical protein
MGSIRQEERIIKWIFNSKDYDTLDMWLVMLKPNNFNHRGPKLMFVMIIEDFDKYDDYNDIIKVKGHEHYYDRTHQRLLEYDLDTKK